jgi:hypothetical protein
MIDELPDLSPDPARRDRTLARCHQTLRRQARPRDQKRFAGERTAVLAFGATYLLSVAFNVAQVLIR